MLESVLVHFSVFKLLLEFFSLAFESFGLNVLPFGFAFFLLGYGLLTDCGKKYMRSQSLVVSIGDSCVLSLGDLLSILGEGSIFLAVVGLLYGDVPPIMGNKNVKHYKVVNIHVFKNRVSKWIKR